MKKLFRNSLMVGSIALGGSENSFAQETKPQIPIEQDWQKTAEEETARPEIIVGSLDSLEPEDGNKKKKSKWSGMLAVEGVNNYFGPKVGANFQPGFAPRVLGSATRDLGKAGTLNFSTWHSFGKGNHEEMDFGVGWSNDKFGADFSRFAIRGGDINQLHGTINLGEVNITEQKLKLVADIFHFSGASKSSPPGGIVGKLTVSHEDKLRVKFLKDILLRESVSIGGDSSPFNLGDGPAGMAFGTIEAIKKLGNKQEIYGKLDISTPIAGKNNTSRGFNWKNFAFGFRKYF